MLKKKIITIATDLFHLGIKEKNEIISEIIQVKGYDLVLILSQSLTNKDNSKH